MSKTYKSEGIVLKSLKYSETSLILDIYTQEKGLQSFIVSGVRKAKSKMANVFSPMNIIDLVAYNSNDKLSRIKEGTYAYTFANLNMDVVRSSIGVFLIDLARSCIKEKEQNEGLYHYLKNELVELDTHPKDIANLPLRYCISMASHLGFSLSSDYHPERPFFDLGSGQFIEDDIRRKYTLDEEKSLQLHSLMSHSPTLRLTRPQRAELLDDLIKYYKIHVEGFHELRSLNVLRTILS